MASSNRNNGRHSANALRAACAAYDDDDDRWWGALCRCRPEVCNSPITAQLHAAHLSSPSHTPNYRSCRSGDLPTFAGPDRVRCRDDPDYVALHDISMMPPPPGWALGLALVLVSGSMGLVLVLIVVQERVTALC
jgi:hypothetical protein